jgi:hypothetical protein
MTRQTALNPPVTGGSLLEPQISEGVGECDDELDGVHQQIVPSISGNGEGNGEDAPELFYPTSPSSSAKSVQTPYRRQLYVQGGVTWCPQW